MALPPVQDWPAHYGPGVIHDRCRDATDYVAVTSPSAWRAVEPHLPAPARHVAFVASQEEEATEVLLAGLPRTEYVLGIGGGIAVDTAKYVAWKTGSRLILVPTIVSSGAIFQPHFPSRRNGKCTILSDIAAPELVVFDTDIISAAPPHLNAAGMAECICWLGHVASWQWWCEQGLPGPEWDQGVADEVHEWVASRTEQYVGDLDAEGRPGTTAIRVCAEVNRERWELRLGKLGAGHGLDHLLDNTFVRVHERNLLHGELVALGTLITCLAYAADPDLSRRRFDACGTRYLPVEIGCTWDEVRDTIAAIPLNADELGWPATCLHHRELDFDRVVKRIEAG